MADDVVKRLAKSITPEQQPAPQPERQLSPEQERKFDEAAFSRNVQTGAIDLSDPNTQQRLTPEARAFVERRIKEQREEAERRRVIEALRRYWYGPDPVERLSGSIEGAPLPVEVVPQVDVDAPANSFAPLPQPRPHGGYR